MVDIPKIGKIGGLTELPEPAARSRGLGGGFAATLKDAVNEVDMLQKSSEAAQRDFAEGKEVELHEVLIKVEEAEIAFRTMMAVRTKLVDAYREILRMGSGG